MLQKNIILAVFFVCAQTICFSQEHRFQHITTINGLAHNEVRKITKDTDGFFWFGTQNGLNRFDGYRFITLKHVPNDNTTIVGDKIYALAPSKDKLWVGTTNGLSILDTRTLKVVFAPKISKALDGKAILHLFYDRGSTIWASTENANFIIDVETLEINVHLKSHKVACVTRELNGFYWIGSDKGLLKYDMEKSKIIEQYHIGSFDIYEQNQIYANSNGEVWATLGERIYRYQSERDRFVLEYRSRSLNAIAEDRDGSIFFGSYGNGLIQYSRKTGEFSLSIADPEKHYSISSNDVYDVFVDDENIIWVGTQEGLDYYDYTKHRFNSIVHIPAKGNSLRSSFVQSLYGFTEDTLWVGTRDGIDEVVFSDGYSKPRVAPAERTEKQLKALNGKYITCIYKDSKNRIWVGTNSNGLYMYRKRSKSLTHFGHSERDSLSIASNATLSVLEDNLGRVWFGTNNGLSLLNEEKTGEYTFKNFTHSEHKGQLLPLNYIYAVYQDSKDRIWLGMNQGGVALLQEKKGKIDFLRFMHDPSNPMSLSNNEVFVIYEDSKQRVWFGTSQGGLNVLRENTNPTKGQKYCFENFTELDGLSDNEVNAILEDGFGYLWIATNKGLSKFDTEKEGFVNYTSYDGVLKGKFRKNARWKMANGTLFFGGAAGLNFFDPGDFKINKVPPSLRFTKLMIDGKEIGVGQKLDGNVVLSSPLDSNTDIILPFDNNRFEIEFTALSFASPYRNQYSYMLEGVDSSWQSVSGANPQATYSLLKPGKYRLNVKASNNDGIWSNEQIYLNVHVRSAPYSGNTLKIGLIILGGTIVVLLLRRTPYMKSHKKRKSPKTFDPKAHKENKEKIAVLESLMETEMPYLDPELGLNGLSEKLDITPNHLSMLLNDYIGKNFYDYVNQYRVGIVKKRLVDPMYANRTISSIGGDCGFNSKSAFNRIFKNSTGKTPSEYRKSMN